MHTVFALLCFVVVIHWLIFPYPSGLLHWHCGNLTIALVRTKQPRWIWINTSFEFIMNDYITTTKQSTTKPCAYFLGYTVLLTFQHATIRGESSTLCRQALHYGLQNKAQMTSVIFHVSSCSQRPFCSDLNSSNPNCLWHKCTGLGLHAYTPIYNP